VELRDLTAEGAENAKEDPREMNNSDEARI